MRYRSWAEIELNVIMDNVKLYKTFIPKKKEIMAVIKANAYGHGDIEVAKALYKDGIDNFAVATLSEGVRLRENGISGQILILGYTDSAEAEILYKYDIMQTLVSEEHAKAFAETGYPVKCQFAVDTGMHRIGLDAVEEIYCVKTIRNYYNSSLIINGFFTHLCTADSNDELAMKFTQEQIEKFEFIANGVQDLHFPYVHCMNSAGGLWHDSNYGSFVRLGIIMYGLKPNYYNVLSNGIRPALSWKSVVEMVKNVHGGETIGYGQAYRAEHDMIVATIATGYADGYNRLLSNRGYILINGKRASIIGRICMDQFMVDVSNIDGVGMGTEAVLIGQSGEEVITADDMAQMIGTIGYEIVCNINNRVERVYIS